MTKWPENLEPYEVLLEGLPDPLRRSIEALLPPPDADGIAEFQLTIDEDLRHAELGDAHSDLFGTHYEDLGTLSEGVTIEVRRVRDMNLDRIVLLELTTSATPEPAALSRFIAEAKALSQLHHPSIPSVLDVGRLPDGRWFCTREEARGRPLTELIDEVHRLSDKQWFGGSTYQWTMWGLLSVFAKVCDAIAYAHEQGVIHRTLRPGRIFVGNHGEVVIGGWECLQIDGHSDYAVDAGELDPNSHHSEPGPAGPRELRPMPHYLAPEYAGGEPQKLRFRGDVYALGAILYHILSGGRPYGDTSGGAVLWQIITGPPMPLVAKSAPGHGADTMIDLIEDIGDQGPSDLPNELVECCNMAMSRDRKDRFANGSELVEAIHTWLNGTARQLQALSKVDLARAQEPEAASMRTRAAALREYSRELLADTPSYSHYSNKERGWAKEDEAIAFEKKSKIKERQKLQLLREALYSSPELVEAHLELATYHRGLLEAAEAEGEKIEASWQEERLRFHAEALPLDHPDRERHLSFLKGTGLLTIISKPVGAEVQLERIVERKRRLKQKRVKIIGRTPLRSVPLAMGSYLLKLKAQSHEVTSVPVFIGRNEDWDGIRPGSDAPTVVRLPSSEVKTQGTQKRTTLGMKMNEEEAVDSYLNRLDSAISELRDVQRNATSIVLHPDDVLIPGGWFLMGGAGSESKRVWVDSFIIRKFPVTNAAYLAFLDHLVTKGQATLAQKLVPREMTDSGQLGQSVYSQDPDGLFVLKWEDNNSGWLAEAPVVLVDWLGISLFSKWLSNETGELWRLPTEVEWEKAARGVDGRLYPWGNFKDPSFCCLRESRKDEVMPASAYEFKADVSPYGVRGMGGNVMEWTSSVVSDTPDIDENSIALPSNDFSPVLSRVIRGCAWDDSIADLDLSLRRFSPGRHRAFNLGFRLARSLPKLTE